MNPADIIKQNILNLFDDNNTGDISPEDMRTFVDTIFDYKQNKIYVFFSRDEIYPNNPDILYPIQKNDLIVLITEGVFISVKNSPLQNDIKKIANLNYDEFIKLGKNDQLITINNGKLKWIDPLPGYFIEGTDEIINILSKRPDQRGVIYIASNTDLSASVPGYEGDGYSWTGYENGWINIGPLRGPAGNPSDLEFATQKEVNSGIIDNKAISPNTFQNSLQLNHLQYQINGKEKYLGSPSNNNDILISDINDNRSWTDINDLDIKVRWGNIYGDIINQSDLSLALNNKLDKSGGTIDNNLSINGKLNQYEVSEFFKTAYFHESIKVGYNINNNSGLTFRDDSISGIPTLIWNCIDKQFQVDKADGKNLKILDESDIKPLLEQIEKLKNEIKKLQESIPKSKK